MILVLDVVRPDSPENPWKNKGVRYRNQLIVNLFEAVGCRRGESLKLRVHFGLDKGDIKTNPRNNRRYLNIRAKVDLTDRRTNRPEAKTLGRHFPIDNRLSEMIDNYIVYYRSEVKGVNDIPYLFISHNHKSSKNNPISLDQVNKIFREISKIVGFRVHPHALRHSWNDKFSKYADKRIAEGKTTHEKAEADRRKLMGWGESSRWGNYYEMRHAHERAFNAGLELQEVGSVEISQIVGRDDDEIFM